ncbi:TetR/AcrR family transcriptional regulator [Nocardioides sediminis]|uniref:TetR/AcrR family transcriptional regulator n=1 Tax=Nocardioides sediminis TaxID=433648 RepID=UPI000D308E9A|nr:TetR/AcrR family transcriptional regulator [Nocardioides sediminis]
MTPADMPTRPRVEGDREQQVLDAALAVLAEVGYDRLTMEAVATRAKASKATLYRRWSNKLTLVIDALVAQKATPEPPDTGSLRGDLAAAYCGLGGLTDRETVTRFTSVLTAIGRDPEFAEAYRTRVLGPKVAQAVTIFERARARGELRDDLDVTLIAPALPGIVLHRFLVLGEAPSPDLVDRVIDQIILPAAISTATGADVTGSH